MHGTFIFSHIYAGMFLSIFNLSFSLFNNRFNFSSKYEFDFFKSNLNLSEHNKIDIITVIVPQNHTIETI